MESSSENSFTWTDTSSDSIDSPSIKAEDSTIDNLKLDDAKKLRSCNGTKVELENNFIIEKKKYRPQKMVKLEPDSDSDSHKKVKKIKHIENDIGYEKARQDSASYDESFLNLQVKQEDIITDKKRKKKKKQRMNRDESDSETNVAKMKLKETSPDFYSGTNEFENEGEIKRKKKKKKLKRRSDSEEVNYKMKHEDFNTNNNETKSVTNKYTRRISESSLIENTFQNETSNEISAIQCDDHNLHTLSFNYDRNIEKESQKVTDSLYKSTLINQFDGQLAEHRKSRLSDRIQFEDDSDNEISHGYNNQEDKINPKLQRFISSCTNVKPISQDLHHASGLTDDDELWIGQCPKDLDIQAFSGKDLNIHAKSKFKVDGQTFDVSLNDEQCDTVAVMTVAHGKYEINNIPLSGIIKFHKRIPKAHFRDDNIMVNNQTNFIPLPETKCRHPLFGFHYKKALKVPVAIALRLNQQNGEDEEAVRAHKRKKKKHKKDKTTLEFEETDCKSQVKIVLEQDPILNITEKRTKKRQHADDGVPAPKRAKRFKHDPESVEAWDSEKAIEQNLFNY